MNKMMYKEININKVLYKTLTLPIILIPKHKISFKSVKNKEGWIGGLVRPTFSPPDW